MLPDLHPLAALDEVMWGDLADEPFIVSEAAPGQEIHDHLVRELADLGRHPEIQVQSVGRDNLLPLVAISYAMSYSNRVVGIALVARQQPQAIFHSQVVQSLFFWTIGIAATYEFGLAGAAVTMVGATLVQALVLMRAYRSDVSPKEHLTVTEMMMSVAYGSYGGLR